MNNLFATWHHGGDLGDGSQLDVTGLLARAETRLADVPELEEARRHVTAALADVVAWIAPPPVIVVAGCREQASEGGAGGTWRSG